MHRGVGLGAWGLGRRTDLRLAPAGGGRERELEEPGRDSRVRLGIRGLAVWGHFHLGRLGLLGLLFFPPRYSLPGCAFVTSDAAAAPLLGWPEPRKIERY